MENNFFGIGKNSSDYDNRRHLNLLFQGIIIYHAHGNNLFDEIAKKSKTLSTSQLVKWTEDNILNPTDEMFLISIKEKLRLTDEEYKQIISFVGIADSTIRSPAGYSNKNNVNILIHLCCLRTNMYGQGAIQFIGYINHWVKSFKLTFDTLESIYKLTLDAVEKYSPFSDMDKIENYVHNKIQMRF